MRALGLDPVHDTRRTFRALLDVLARPGTVAPAPVEPADHAVLATLVDHEVGLHTEDDRLREALATAGRLTPAPLETADLIHVHGGTDGRIGEASRGTLKEPSEGATVVVRVDGLAAGPGDEPADGVVTVAVTGPGVDGERRFRVAGLPAAEIEAVAAATDGYPRGIELVLAAPGRLAALPRSVAPTVEGVA